MTSVQSYALTRAAWVSIPRTSVMVISCGMHTALIYIGSSNPPALDATAIALRAGDRIDLTARLDTGALIFARGTLAVSSEITVMSGSGI